MKKCSRKICEGSPLLSSPSSSLVLGSHRLGPPGQVPKKISFIWIKISRNRKCNNQPLGQVPKQQSVEGDSNRKRFETKTFICGGWEKVRKGEKRAVNLWSFDGENWGGRSRSGAKKPEVHRLFFAINVSQRQKPERLLGRDFLRLKLRSTICHCALRDDFMIWNLGELGFGARIRQDHLLLRPANWFAVCLFAHFNNSRFGAN